MLTNIAFTVPGEPQGKGRARIGRIAGHARMFTPAKTAAYEGLIAMAAQQAMGSGSPFSGPLAVEIDAVHTIPASWSKKRRGEALAGLLRPTVKPDIDNIAKAVADGGNGVAWVDDRQIVRLLVVRSYGETPGLRVRVAETSNGSSPGTRASLGNLKEQNMATNQQPQQQGPQQPDLTPEQQAEQARQEQQEREQAGQQRIDGGEQSQG